MEALKQDNIKFPLSPPLSPPCFSTFRNALEALKQAKRAGLADAEAERVARAQLEADRRVTVGYFCSSGRRQSAQSLSHCLREPGFAADYPDTDRVATRCLSRCL